MRLSTALTLLLAFPAGAFAAVGHDYGGDTDLIPANGETLSGTFTNVRLFSIPAGVTAFVAPGVPLAVYAATASIRGTLDGSDRGQSGGNGGTSGTAGLDGFDGSGSGSGVGKGLGGPASKGGGGGGSGGNGGAGAGAAGVGGGGGGGGYGSTGTVTIPMSADDAFMGSGGGGGGGGGTAIAGPTGGSGAAGGGSIYIEAASMTVTGSILVAGSTASAVSDTAIEAHPGAGGGGGGGTILLRVTGPLGLHPGSMLSANGGPGGDVNSTVGGTVDPGGGGAGGRVKVFYRTSDLFAAVISTAGGSAGRIWSGAPDGQAAQAGSVGRSSWGVVAAAPAGLLATGVYVTSISWVWTAAADFGDGPTTSYYRIFPATVTAPYPGPESTPLAAGTTVVNLTPNTTYYRFVTAFTDWGDSLPSNKVSTHTLANTPGPAATAFTGMGAASLTLNWTAGNPQNPGYTNYQVDRALDQNFGSGLNTGFVAALSSSPAALTPNTTYYFRARAINADNVPSPYAATLATATLAALPTGAGFGTVYVTSAVFQWSAAGNPPDTLYAAQVSSDNFFSLSDASTTLNASATFFVLTPGTQYYFRVRAVNRNWVPTDFTASVSTRSGNLSDVSVPAAPGAPVVDRRFSYDGAAVFSWPAASSPVGILDYNLLIGSTPGGSDFFNGSTTTLSYQAAGLSSGQTYYARVRARSNAGVFSDFSGISAGLPVFITSQAPVIPKPYNWPNPFNPSQGPTQIGVYLSEPATVVVRIYTLTGALVRELSQQVSGTGNQVVSWDGNGSSGSKVAPGGYIVKVEKRYAGSVETQRFKIAVLY